ncbi:MAG: M48 family metallopeptidase [bacterium]|nr:M48 family metallopeptidase [bacterium]
MFKIVFRRRVIRRPRRGTRVNYLKYKEAARELVKRRLEYYNRLYQFKIGRVSIKNHKSRWGSCSKKGNLNFNYKLALLPPEMADYVIVHELCHLGEFNHSKNFWKLVAMSIPDYLEIKNKFKKIHV